MAVHLNDLKLKSHKLEHSNQLHEPQQGLIKPVANILIQEL